MPLQLTVESETQWMDSGLCRQGQYPGFLHYDPDPDSRDKAIEMCLSCPVRKPCLKHAVLSREPHGIWGGKTERQRRSLRREYLDGALRDFS